MATTAVKEHPILMSGPMARAILEGRKTQTRRIVRWKSPEPGLNLGFSGLSAGHYCTGLPSSGHVLYSRRGDGAWEQRTKPTFCRYGSAGDRLWVREPAELASVCGYNVPGATMELRYLAGGRRAFDRDAFGTPYATGGKLFARAVPGIHMPRWASRITLEIESVRVERLNSISEEDAVAEGFAPYSNGFAISSAREGFSSLWDQLNGDKPGRDWASNPWVFAVSFRRVEA